LGLCAKTGLKEEVGIESSESLNAWIIE